MCEAITLCEDPGLRCGRLTALRTGARSSRNSIVAEWHYEQPDTSHTGPSALP